MATLKVSLSGTAAPTSSPSPSLKSWPHISDSPPKISVVARFPNATVLTPPKLRLQASLGKKTRASVSAAMETGGQEVLPPALTSTSDPPPIFDGNTRLVYLLDFALLRCILGLEEKIQLVSIDLQDRPAWYKEKVYLANKDPAKKEFGEELLSYTDSFNRSVFSSVKQDEIESADWTFDYIETALSKLEDGPLFLGKFSLVIWLPYPLCGYSAYAPSLGRFQLYLMDLKKYDIAAGRPKLAAWIEMFRILLVCISMH
ncbi:hypothetical protein FF1_041144 [Malus domestica]